jgi:hypothetical protein
VGQTLLPWIAHPQHHVTTVATSAEPQDGWPRAGPQRTRGSWWSSPGRPMHHTHWRDVWIRRSWTETLVPRQTARAPPGRLVTSARCRPTHMDTRTHTITTAMDTTVTMHLQHTPLADLDLSAGEAIRAFFFTGAASIGPGRALTMAHNDRTHTLLSRPGPHVHLPRSHGHSPRHVLHCLPGLPLSIRTTWTYTS